MFLCVYQKTKQFQCITFSISNILLLLLLLLSLVYYFTEQTLFAYWIHIERTVIGQLDRHVHAPIKFAFDSY